MGTGVPGLAREDLWPTGDMPGELRAAMVSEAAAMGAAATHEVVPSGVALAPREFDPAALAAERPPIVEGDALLENLRKAANGNARPAQVPPMRPAVPVFATSADLHYAFPLGATGARAEVNLYGKIGASDVELLVEYLKLTARKMKHGETANARLSEHNSDGPDETLPAKRSRVRTGTGR